MAIMSHELPAECSVVDQIDTHLKALSSRKREWALLPLRRKIELLLVGEQSAAVPFDTMYATQQQKDCSQKTGVHSCLCGHFFYGNEKFIDLYLANALHADYQGHW